MNNSNNNNDERRMEHQNQVSTRSLVMETCAGWETMHRVKNMTQHQLSPLLE